MDYKQKSKELNELFENFTDQDFMDWLKVDDNVKLITEINRYKSDLVMNKLNEYCKPFVGKAIYNDIFTAFYAGYMAKEEEND